MSDVDIVVIGQALRGSLRRGGQPRWVGRFASSNRVRSAVGRSPPTTPPEARSSSAAAGCIPPTRTSLPAHGAYRIGIAAADAAINAIQRIGND
jgi:hypothetical protein